jgi:hypothetical protein
MADTSKSSFLGSISPWSASRSSTPPPKSPRTDFIPDKEDGLKPSSGLDHSISLRPSPSLRRYPKDVPPLRTRWYYAVDVAKRKPFAPEQNPAEKAKPVVAPKKLVPFSTSDSQAIENAFQSLDRGDLAPDENAITETKVPVNEDYLFDVHIEKRELEPAYWLGPVYEVRRGSWFFQDGATLRPCDENLANQLEEGYLKTTPWRKLNLAAPRSSSQPRSRPTSLILDAVATVRDASPGVEKQAPTSETPGSSNYRLFGTYMNTTVTYQDGTAAFLSTDDFMSRMSSTVYGRFGGMGGTKVVRGYTEAGKPAEAAGSKEGKSKVTANASSEQDASKKVEKAEDEKGPPKRNALERQLSSLAGIPDIGDSDKLAEEEARQQEEEEMEDARDKVGDDQGRKIDHLVLVTHGVGQRLGLRLDSINFIHDVNVLRKTMKAVYESAPDLQALSDMPNNCSIQVLPICWRHLLDFPRQSLKQNREESDIGDDMNDSLDEDYPSLQDITVEGVPAVRNLITDLAMDVLLYQSAYREHIASIVQKECNRVHALFKERTGFTGKVSLCGHSLGSAILFDILCRQSDDANEKKTRRRASTKDSTRTLTSQRDLKLDFDCDSFFCLGSPIAMFQMLKGRTISGRQPSSSSSTAVPPSPFDPDPFSNDPFSESTGPTKPSSSLIPITTSSPKCAEFYNIFHPTDPIAYRCEPLISPAMAQLKPQPLPYTKKGLFAAPGLSNISARVTQQLTSSWFNLTSGAASMLINRSLGITGEEQALPMDKGKATAAATAIVQTPSSGNATTAPNANANTMPISDGQKQQELADAALKSSDPTNRPTLIDAEIETLYSGFQKRRSQQPSGPASNTGSNPKTNVDEPASSQDDAEKARKLKREEGKVLALNSNGRVDYHIQEGMFDVSLLASIASHLSYWADEDVNHFMIGQMLKGGRGKGRGG